MDGGGRDIKAIVAKPHETKPSTCEGYELRRIARIVGRRSMWDRRVDDPGRDRKRKSNTPAICIEQGTLYIAYQRHIRHIEDRAAVFDPKIRWCRGIG